MNTEVNWDWKTSALSSAVSALLPPAVVWDGMPTMSFLRDLIDVVVSPFVDMFWIITFENICNVVSVCHIQLLFHQLC